MKAPLKRRRRRSAGGKSAPVRGFAEATLERLDRRRSDVLGAVAVAARKAGRVITPARALVVVALVATICLGASQLGDYRAVEVGAPQYRGVDTIAPAPELQRRTPRAAHGLAVVLIAVGSGLVLALAVARNRRLARLLVFSGAAVIAISLLVDAPKGLREGSVGIAYQGANAVLLGPFWVQLASAVTLMVVGPLLAAGLGERGARRSRRTRRRSRGAGRAGTPGPAAEVAEAKGAAT